jgi:hypothetical protein
MVSGTLHVPSSTGKKIVNWGILVKISRFDLALFAPIDLTPQAGFD